MKSEKTLQRIAIIGAGPTGIAMGRELLQRGMTNFDILEKNSAAGGTWHQHSYPGLACDVWAHSYSYSFALNPDWSANYVERAEIEAYLQQCAREFGLEPHLKFNSAVERCVYQGDGKWEVTLAGGQTEMYDVLINAGGNQHTPVMPAIEGIEDFKGPSWHSTHWDDSVELKGKRIAVIGSAAAAVQIVPEIAADAEHLYVVQRRPNWLMERGRKPYSNWQKRLFKTVPPVLKAIRKVQGFFMSMMHQAAQLGNKRMQTFEDMAVKYLHSKIEDPAMRESLTPSTRYGCQRGLVSDGYYEALLRDNVTLVNAAAEKITETSVQTSDGQCLDVDIIIYCTGYKVLDYDRFEVLGVEGESLAATMEKAPEAYKGMSVPGFPNYFYAIGPNGLILSASYFVTVEIAVAALARLLDDKQQANVTSMSVKRDKHRAFNDWALSQFPRFSWGHSSCNSYYRLDSGHAPFLYPGSADEYRAMKDEVGLHEYDTA